MVPKIYRELVMKALHNLDHPSPTKTASRVNKGYLWPTLDKGRGSMGHDMHPLPACQDWSPHPPPPLKPKLVRKPLFSDFEIDIVGPLLESEWYRYLLTILCRTMRLLKVIPMVNSTMVDCCNAFIRGWVKNFGLPAWVLKVLRDYGHCFIT